VRVDVGGVREAQEMHAAGDREASPNASTCGAHVELLLAAVR
jgi:hypothetical protein